MLHAPMQRAVASPQSIAEYQAFTDDGEPDGGYFVRPDSPHVFYRYRLNDHQGRLEARREAAKDMREDLSRKRATGG